MIRYIRGVYAMPIENGIVVENNSGIGFEISVPSGSPLYKIREGEQICVYTAMMVKEDDISLYGFHDRDSLSLFRMLITVNGIGAKGALAIMGSLSVEELKRAIIYEDVKAISKANGVGKKTAERLILELKDKMGKMETADYHGENITVAMVGEDLTKQDYRTEAIHGLVSLGYSKAEAFAAVSKVMDENLSTEEYIKKALKNLF